MKRLYIASPLFSALSSLGHCWWNNLIADKDIYIDIRKDNYIDIYYNGGSIIKELKYVSGDFKGKVNYKYLLSNKAEYIDYDFVLPKVALKKSIVDLLVFSDFDSVSLKRIKDNIRRHYPASSEKGLQAKFVTKCDCFIDSEFAYNYAGIKLRIDLVWLDVSNKKIVLVELKTMGDSRLYTHEIYEQLKKYNDFAIKYETDILEYYEKVFQIKKSLGLLPRGLKSISDLSGFFLEKKPLLLFGDCQQEWIDNNAVDINAKIDKVAVGAYYFGKPEYDCNIVAKTSKNRYIF